MCTPRPSPRSPTTRRHHPSTSPPVSPSFLQLPCPMVAGEQWSWSLPAATGRPPPPQGLGGPVPPPAASSSLLSRDARFPNNPGPSRPAIANRPVLLHRARQPAHPGPRMARPRFLRRRLTGAATGSFQYPNPAYGRARPPSGLRRPGSSRQKEKPAQLSTAGQGRGSRASQGPSSGLASLTTHRVARQPRP